MTKIQKTKPVEDFIERQTNYKRYFYQYWKNWNCFVL